MTKSQKNLRNFTLAGALALTVAAISAIASPATSAPSHDGLWSVVIITALLGMLAGGRLFQPGLLKVTLRNLQVMAVQFGRLFVVFQFGQHLQCGNLVGA